MKITAEDLRVTYRYLLTLHPFNKWDFPPESQIIDFVVNRSQQLQGEYDTDPHTIKASSYFCKTWQDVLETVAHEMVHLACEKKGHYRHAEHDPQFKRMAKQVCKSFGWKEETF